MIERKPTNRKLLDISPDEIRRNPDNPRLFFRSEELDTLQASIRKYGIQVPITVYYDDIQKYYVLIDGERRWRCARKLNLKKIPALIQTKPSALNNLLLMFNIHALREQWDYLTIANKLPEVISFFEEENEKEPSEIELSEITGLTRGQIRRCRFLLDLPSRYRKRLESELELPKHMQKLSEDFFIEMERALKTVGNRIPESIESINYVRDTLIDKFERGVISNITDFRMLSKIATSISNIGVKESKAQRALERIFNRDNEIGIEEVYFEQFESKYDSRKVVLNIDSLLEYFSSSALEDGGGHIENQIRERLIELRRLIDQILS